jgi:hypothetical protein
MRHIAVLVLAGVVGCGDGGPGGGGSVGSYGQAADQAAKAMKELEGILDGIKDTASAAAAKPPLDALAKRLKAVVAGVERLGEPGADADKAAQTMEQAIESLSPKTMEYLNRVFEDPEIAKALGDSLAAVQKEIGQLRGMLGG